MIEDNESRKSGWETPSQNLDLAIAIPSADTRLFIWAVQVLIEDLGHGKHVDPILLEDSSHRIVASNLASVTGVL